MSIGSSAPHWSIENIAGMPNILLKLKNPDVVFFVTEKLSLFFYTIKIRQNNTKNN